MKIIIYILALAIASISSFFIGVTYQSNEFANRSENTIANEFQITERNFNIPSCSDISKAATEKVSLTKNGSDFILWTYDDQQNLIKKTIVTSNMNTIYTETPLACENN